METSIVDKNLNEISPALRRKIKRLHKRMAEDDAAGGVQPKPVTNKRTGKVHEFGRRRALDGAWLFELLSHGGCTKEDVESFVYVLDLLLEHDVDVDQDLSGFLVKAPSFGMIVEPLTSDEKATCRRSNFRVIEEGSNSTPTA